MRRCRSCWNCQFCEVSVNDRVLRPHIYVTKLCVRQHWPMSARWCKDWKRIHRPSNAEADRT